LLSVHVYNHDHVNDHVFRKSRTFVDGDVIVIVEGF
jgi:hypothetical protein